MSGQRESDHRSPHHGFVIASLNSAKLAVRGRTDEAGDEKNPTRVIAMATPVMAKSKVPAMKPSCTAFVSQPMSEGLRRQSTCSSSAALLALNQSDVQSSSAKTMMGMGLTQRRVTAR